MPATPALGATLACQPIRSVQRAFQPLSPHETYVRSLESAGLGGTALAREWVEASSAALAAATPISPPFEEHVLMFWLVPCTGRRVEKRRRSRGSI